MPAVNPDSELAAEALAHPCRGNTRQYDGQRDEELLQRLRHGTHAVFEVAKVQALVDALDYDMDEWDSQAWLKAKAALAAWKVT
jgi:hypothetical protein